MTMKSRVKEYDVAANISPSYHHEPREEHFWPAKGGWLCGCLLGMAALAGRVLAGEATPPPPFVEQVGVVETAIRPGVVCPVTADTQVGRFRDQDDNEQLWNWGAAERIKLKRNQEFCLFKFDTSACKGQRVKKATLYLPRTEQCVLSRLAISTVSADWEEGSGKGDPGELPIVEQGKFSRGGATFTHAVYPDRPWVVVHPANALDYLRPNYLGVVRGEGGSLWAEVPTGWASLDGQDYYWAELPLNVAQSLLIPGETYGLSVAEEKGSEPDKPGAAKPNPNHFIKARESGKGAFLVLDAAAASDNAPPGAVTELAAESGPGRAQITISFKVPSAQGGRELLGYRLYVSEGGPLTAPDPKRLLERWRTPRPLAPLSRQQVRLNDLTPGALCHVLVTAYDSVGNESPAAFCSAIAPAFDRSALPGISLAVAPEKGLTLPEYLDPTNHQPPNGKYSDFPVPTVVIDGEFWVIYKNGYDPRVIRYKGTTIENGKRQADGSLDLTHPKWGKVVAPYMLGGMWYDPSDKKLYAPMHCEYSSQYGAGDTYGTKLNRQIHLAVSEDKGLTWKYAGPIITRDDPAAPQPESAFSGRLWHGGDGDFILFADEKDQYVYIFSSHYLWPKPGQKIPRLWGHRVARCAFADKMAPGKWKRFYNGSFSEPGLGGKASLVNGFGVMYSRALKRYIGFNYGSALSVCTDLSRQDWSPKYYVPGDYWGCNSFGFSLVDGEKRNLHSFDRDMYLYRYWHTVPGAAFKLTLDEGGLGAAAAYVAFGCDDFLTNPKASMFPHVSNPTRPYTDPLYDHDDPIMSRRVRKVSCDNAEMKYAGEWTLQAGPVRAKSCDKAGGSVSFTFTGGGIYWRAASATDGGKADVYLDGKLEQTVDFYGDPAPYLFWYIRTDLDATRPHTIKIVVRSDKNAKSAGTAVRHIGFEHAAESTQASDGFCGVQGKNDWRYQAWDGKKGADLEFNVLQNIWSGKGADVVIGHDYQVAEGAGAAARTWVAPHAGTIRIEGSASLEAAGKAVTVKILRNGAEAWPAHRLTPQKPESHDFTLAVAPGDVLSFVAENGDSGSGKTAWDPAITYLRP